MDVKEVLFKTLWELPSLLAQLKWSFEISLKCMFGQLQTADKQTVVELMEKSSVNCLEMAIKILKGVPRLDLTHKFSQIDFTQKKQDTIENQKLMLETLKNLTFAEYNKFVFLLEDELALIWKQRLDEADLLQVVEMMELMFSQDPAMLTKKVMEKMGRPDLLDKLSYLVSATKDTSDAQEHICQTLSNLSPKEFQQFKHRLKLYLPHIAVRELLQADCQNTVDLMVINSFRNCVEMTEKVLKRMERPDLVYKLSHSTSEKKEKMSVNIMKHMRKTLMDLDSEDLMRFKDCLRMNFPHIPKWQLEKADCQEVVEIMEQRTHQQCVEITQMVLRSMERPDLAEKLSDLILMNSEIMTTKACIWETLKDLSDTDFYTFKCRLKTYLPPVSKSDLQKADFQSVFRLMETSLHQNCVDITVKALREINRLDLEQKLSDFTSQNYGGYVLVPGDILDLKVQAMVSVIEVLLDTLGDFSNEELQSFQRKLTNLLHLKPTPSLDMEPLETVFWIVQHYGQQSLEIVIDVFIDMGQTDVSQKLMVSCSEHSKHQFSTVTHKIALVTAVKKLLLDTANYLSYKDMRSFEWFIQFTCFQMGISMVDLDGGRLAKECEIKGCTFPPFTAKETCIAIINAVVKKHGLQSLAVMWKVFINMNRGDVARGLENNSAVQEKTPLATERRALSKKVKEMETIINLLIKSLGHLNFKELTDFKHALMPLYRLSDMETSHVVFFIVQTIGQKSVEITKNLLGSIGRTDLEQKLLKSSSRSKDDCPDDWWWSGLIQKVATMAAVKELLIETLKLLRYEDLKRFKKLLLLNFHDAPHVDMRLWAIAKAELTGTLLLQTYGKQGVGMAFWVLCDMNRKDLANMLPYRIHSPTRKEPTDLRGGLCRILAGLQPVEMNKLKWMLQFTYFKMGLEWIPGAVLEADDLADLIMETSGQRAMEVITEVLEDMNRSDLLSSAAVKPRDRSRMKSMDMTTARPGPLHSFSQSCWWPWVAGAYPRHFGPEALHPGQWPNLNDSKKMKKLLVVLQELSEIKKKHFQTRLEVLCKKNLSTYFVDNYMRMYPDTRDLVELLAAVYGESRSVNMIETVLKEETERRQLEDNVSKLCSSIAENLALESCTTDIWTKLEPEVKKTDADEQITYSLQSEAGSYECSVSGLRWTCKEKVSFQYIFGSWEEHIERMEALQYFPAGPLIDLKVNSGRLEVVYLPHWICIDSPNIEKGLAVLHINDCGDVVEKVMEVTPNHVKLSEPIFSPRAVLMKHGFPVKIYCNVLIYKTNTAFLTLHVYLIPRDRGLQEEMDRREQKYGYNIIRKPHPDKSLKMRDHFVLRAEVDKVEITPQKLKLRYQSPPNFFEVYSKNPNFDLILELAQENEHSPVWRSTIRQDEYTDSAQDVSMAGAQGSHFVDKFKLDLIQRVNNVAQILDHLHKVGIVNAEVYNTIRKLPTSQEKMRELFSGPLRASGDNGKDVFYRILKDKEKHLCDELEALW